MTSAAYFDVSRIRSVLSLTLLMLLLGTSAIAQDSELITDDVERWLQSMDALQATGVAEQPLAMLMASLYDSRNFTQLAGSVAGNVPEMNRAIQTAGYASVDEWAATWLRIWPGFLFIVMSEEIEDARERLEEQRREVEQDPEMDEESRAMMLDEMAFAERSMRIPFEVPESDIEAVAPYRNQLEALFMGLQGRGR